MADNVTIYSGNDGTPFDVATDEIGGEHHQLVIVEWGAPDAATRVTMDDPLPTQEATAVAFDSAVTLSPDDGTLTAPTHGLPVAAMVLQEGSPNFFPGVDSTMRPLVMNERGALYVTLDKLNNADFGTVYAQQSGTWSFGTLLTNYSGTIEAGEQVADVSTVQAVVFQFSGDGDGDWNPEGSLDSVNWFPVKMYAFDGSGGATALHSVDAANGWLANVAGMQQFRMRLSDNTLGLFYTYALTATTGTVVIPT